jgi:hypothetical protein
MTATTFKIGDRVVDDTGHAGAVEEIQTAYVARNTPYSDKILCLRDGNNFRWQRWASCCTRYDDEAANYEGDVGE